ncbi:hypothetical protein KBB68_01565 [Candidatus Babeliales bacterium]|nr:hypothetical protein [Candidatus Babeliales bacterium]
MKMKHLFSLFFLVASGVILSQEGLHPFVEMELGTEEGKRLKEYFFRAENNVFCKEYHKETDRFSSSQCDYSTEAAYQYFNGQKKNSVVPELEFENRQQLEEWAQKQENSYLIAYKPGCVPCANLLAAIETRVQNLRAVGKSVFMVNVRKNEEVFSNEDTDCWYYEGTPEVWHVKSGVAQKILTNAPAHRYFEEFMNDRNF